MIETKNLTKTFKLAKGGEVQAVMGLNLAIAESEVFGFLGPNGAGKTTTIRMLTSLIGPSSGTAQVNGYQLGRDDQQIRASVGILTESPGLFGRLSAKKTLKFTPSCMMSKMLTSRSRNICTCWIYGKERTIRWAAFQKGCGKKWLLHVRCCMNLGWQSRLLSFKSFLLWS